MQFSGLRQVRLRQPGRLIQFGKNDLGAPLEGGRFRRRVPDDWTGAPAWRAIATAIEAPERRRVVRLLARNLRPAGDPAAIWHLIPISGAPPANGPQQLAPANPESRCREPDSGNSPRIPLPIDVRGCAVQSAAKCIGIAEGHRNDLESEGIEMLHLPDFACFHAKRSSDPAPGNSWRARRWSSRAAAVHCAQDARQE